MTIDRIEETSIRTACLQFLAEQNPELFSIAELQLSANNPKEIVVYYKKV